MATLTRRLVVVAAAVVAVVALALAAAGRGGGHTSADPTLGSRLDGVVAAGVPGVLLVVTEDAKTHRVAKGVASRTTGNPLRATDRFRVGSITKTFVASVVLQLVAEGALELDAPVRRWLPGLATQRVTVRQLLSHTSGLADYVDDPAITSRASITPEHLGALALARPGLGAPGRRYAYASTNYVVLGLLIERVTGATLARQLAERIFVPLGLDRTTFQPGAPRLRVHGHRRRIHDGIVGGDPEDTTGESAAWAWSAGAIVSDAGDLTRFMTALVEGQVVPEPLLGLMIPAAGYGLGLAAFPTSCGTALGHTGNLLGYVSVAWISPDARRTVVLMANAYPLSAEADAAIHSSLDAAFCGDLE
jgi:D-alanyl-D-alanine carboxypeptidase